MMDKVQNKESSNSITKDIMRRISLPLPVEIGTVLLILVL
jgi:hypothetical protein